MTSEQREIDRRKLRNTWKRSLKIPLGLREPGWEKMDRRYQIINCGNERIYKDLET